MKNKIKLLIGAGILLIIVAGLVFGIVKLNKDTQQNIPDKDWLHDNCNCTARENLYCNEGYILKGNLCVGETTYTNAILGCSEYNCNGTIYKIRGEE